MRLTIMDIMTPVRPPWRLRTNHQPAWVWRVAAVLACLLCLASTPSHATPANKAALERHYDRFLAKGLNQCTTCHLPSDRKNPESLAEFPHNPFGNRLRVLGEMLSDASESKAGAVNDGPAKAAPNQTSGRTRPRVDLVRRLRLVAHEDSDGDGVDNETELLLGFNPGDSTSKPDARALEAAPVRRGEFAKFLAGYAWRPYESVVRPPVPARTRERWALNPIDEFILAEQEARGLVPRVEASRRVLMRRVYLDLIGLSPTPEEQAAFLADSSAQAYEHLVDQLLDDPRYGERWARHWMDVWRYSDWAGWTDGGQVRDSKPHIWRWRDWIVESLNQDKPYDRMLVEMLAADELAPEDTNALRATGFLVRNYKMLSREQWLEDTIKHTAQAFLGLTLGCAKCHDHMTEPISQKEYYQIRAIFEPHQVRTDRLPGQTNTVLDGLVRVFDAGGPSPPPTWLLERGDERHPRTNAVIQPGVPGFLGGSFAVDPIRLPLFAQQPDKRPWVIQDTLAAGESAVTDARSALARVQTNSAATPDQVQEQQLTVTLAETRLAALRAVLKAEQLEDMKGSEDWQRAATAAALAQRRLTLDAALLQQHQGLAARNLAAGKTNNVAANTNASAKTQKEFAAAQKKFAEAEAAVAAARQALSAEPSTAYRPRATESYPAVSTGRRLAFARWLTEPGNPLTARVAINHIWQRHFGRGLVPTPADFGRNGRPPSHPQLLDWLAAEFMDQNWSMKAMHRLLVTSATYRQASTPDEANAGIDPENVFLWRMNSRRLEAEVVRDNLLYVTGSLDLTRGGPDIDHKLGLSSKRRSLYLRLAAEKEVEFLKIFDGPSVTECYERRPSVVPQQALALANSELAVNQARRLAAALRTEIGPDDKRFIGEAFRRILGRGPGPEETRLCAEFLSRPSDRSRENLVLVLLNHNDFVTVR
jgi:hypothetical protein